jgi:nitroreductase
MDLHEALHSRRTVHAWLPEPVPDEVVTTALAAAHMAPCHKLTWPWTFHRVGPQARASIVRIGLRLKVAKAEAQGVHLDEARREAIRAKLANAGALVVVTQRRTDDPHRSKEDYAATACAIQNLMLSAHAQGFGTKWSTGGVTTHPDTYAALAVDHAVDEIVGFVWVGVPARVPSPPRPDVAEHVRHVP